MTTTDAAIDAAVPVLGTPLRSNTNAVLKSIRDDAEAAKVPAGGTTGQVLKKNSATDYDASWAADNDTQYVPSGGSSGQVLKKNSATDYDVSWAADNDTDHVPAGGTTGQVLKKNSATDYDVGWAADNNDQYVPSGGTTGQVLKKNSATDYDVAWAADNNDQYVPAGGSAGQFLKKNSGTDYDVVWAADNNDQYVPSGGSTNQALVKSSGTDYAVAWDYARKALGVSSKTTTANIVNTDAFNVIRLNSGTAFTVTLVATSFNVGDWVDFVNVNDGDVTISAGTDGINRAGNDSMILSRGQSVRLYYMQGTDPKWLATEVVDRRGQLSFYAEVTAAGSFTIHYRTPHEIDVVSVRARTLGGTCTLQITDDGAAITGFGTAVSESTTETNTSSGATIAKGSKIAATIASPSSLTGIEGSIEYIVRAN